MLRDRPSLRRSVFATFAVLLATALLAGVSLAQTIEIEVEAAEKNKAVGDAYWDTALGVIVGRNTSLLPDIVICLELPYEARRTCAPECRDARRCTARFAVPASNTVTLTVIDQDVDRDDLMFSVTLRRDQPCNPCTHGSGQYQSRYWVTGWQGATPGQVCPAPEAETVIRDMIDKNERDTTDFPRDWRPPAWGMNIPTTAQANRYLKGLEKEQRAILAKAEASKDIMRVYSAAFWFIERSDPSLFTVRRKDYKGQECDIIRNRIVWALGDKYYDCIGGRLLKIFKFGNVRRFMKESLEECLGTFKDLANDPLAIKDAYNDANSAIDKIFGQPLYSATRADAIKRVAALTGKAMHDLGYGSCDFYPNAVLAWDEEWWRHQTLRYNKPHDWEHEFIDSLIECMLNQ